MSKLKHEHHTALNINDQEIFVDTSVDSTFKTINYTLYSDVEMLPEVVAVALYLMCDDICSKANIKVDDLIKNLVDLKNTAH